MKYRSDAKAILSTPLSKPSSLNGPPPIQAMLKAKAAEEARQLERQKEAEEQKARDTFLHADLAWQIPIIIGMLNLGYLAAQSRIDTGPWYAAQIQRAIGLPIIQWVWRISVGLHVGESVIACGICLNRGWYSATNTAKWTLSTFLFGFASLSKLLRLGKQGQEKMD